MKRSEIDATLNELYSRVPKMIGCDGRCWISCGPADMADRERARLREAGYRITPPVEAHTQAETFWCEALTADHRCAVYEIRPLICRIWGAAESIQCPYGCVPAGGFLSDDEVVSLLAEAENVGGGGLPLGDLPEAAAEAAAAVARNGNGGIEIRMQHNIPAAFRKKMKELPCPSCGFMLTPPADVKVGRCGNCMQMVLVG
jgi:Fe-S-cluster containining protein